MTDTSHDDIVGCGMQEAGHKAAVQVLEAELASVLDPIPHTSNFRGNYGTELLPASF